MIGGFAAGLGAQVTLTPFAVSADVTALGGWGMEKDVADAGALSTPADNAMPKVRTRMGERNECIFGQ
ncbi:unannotated protein [freshwater metagenome]|uniref:Unannotated protein n=1 Tax=freshwater metagenome TaxID=449393 RepID=A0A6J7NES2_9ZZZZ